MIFNYIKLTNFRQYKGENVVEFSNPSNKGPITLIVAENGVGKTTFLQAFRYCFYGNLSNNKYINLPNSENLMTDTIASELEDGDRSSLSVEVSFEHVGKTFIIRRETKHIKVSGKMKALETISSLSVSSDLSGYKTINNEEADLEMMKLLPSGLSHIFMFDGERMERRIDSNEFRSDLKESVLGILNIRSYESLIEHIGLESKKRTLIGRLSGRITYTTVEAQEESYKLDKLRNSVVDTENKLKQLKDDLDAQNKHIAEAKQVQLSLEENRKKVEERNALEGQINLINSEMSRLSTALKHIGFNALYKKELIRVRKLYNDFLRTKKDERDFYQFLHIDTLNEILERKKCICGEYITPGSSHEEHIKRLFATSLPHFSAQNLSFISSDIFNNASNLAEDKKTMLELYSELNEKADEKRSIGYKIEKLNFEIKESESKFGGTSQVSIEERTHKIETINREIGEQQRFKQELETLVQKQENILKPMIDENSRNQKINSVIKQIKEIKKSLEQEKEKLEEKARKVLSKHFNDNLSTIMSGNYSTEINKDYSIVVTDVDKKENVTPVLSTGQSVVVSISFIHALIATAAELSNEYNRNEKYAVIMDAALSNLDEKHIAKVSKYNLNTFKQLIFISVKRQLRDEMFVNIKPKIGIAYEFTRESNRVNIKRIDNKYIGDFIHEMAGETNNA